ncbi:MAG: hypothetical protein HRU28_13865, partial [Rhizobiales bacterium]|nr:hypothetical protein [Hyphomicrobiales bacterium]
VPTVAQEEEEEEQVPLPPTATPPRRSRRLLKLPAFQQPKSTAFISQEAVRKVMATGHFDDPECIAAGGAAYKVLIDICAPFKHNAAGARITETAVWALLHGFSSFAQFGVIEDASNLEKSDATLIDTNEYENIKLRIQDLINMLNLEVS